MDEIFHPTQAAEILQSAVKWLQTNDESDFSWRVKTERVQFCLTEMNRKISQPIRPAYTGHVPTLNPDIQVLRRAAPGVDRMFKAMRQRARGQALEAANAAIGVLTGGTKDNPT